MACPLFAQGSVCSELPPPPAIWVRRWAWEWIPTAAPDGQSCTLLPQATCSFLQGDMALPAVQDWPRWKPNQGDGSLPLDEYYKVQYIPQYVCGDEPSAACGLQVTWQPVWTRIDTPRAWRWVPSCVAQGGGC